MPFRSTANGAACVPASGSVGNANPVPGMFVNAICPVSSLIQNSEITELSAISERTALIWSASMPACSAASMK